MTCIVAATDGTNVYMAGDLMGSNGFTANIYSKSKVFINSGFVFGYTTSFRMGQLLEYHWSAPSRTEGKSDDEYLYTDVVDSFIDLFKDNDYGHKKQHELETGEFIFGYKGRLFIHQGNHSILEVEKFACVGSGQYHAEAAMYTILEHVAWKEDYAFLLTSAINVAAKMVPSVSEEYTFIVLPGEEV